MAKAVRPFFIYPDPSNTRWKCKVKLVKSVKQVTKFYNEAHPENTDEIGGLFTSYTVYNFKKGEKGKLTGEFGQIILAIDFLNINALSHEVGHAAHEYCRRVRKTKFSGRSKKNLVTDHEEVYCYALGYMVDQVMNRLVRAGYGFAT